MKDLLSPETHNDCTKVKIPDTKALRDIKQIRNVTGFYDGIDSTGSWIYDDIAHKWAKTA